MSFTTPSWLSGKRLLFKYLNFKDREEKERAHMDIGAYFETLKYILMTATFVALVLIFLYAFYGKEEETG